MVRMSKKANGDLYYSAWATAWGPMGAVLGAAGLRRVVLPHYTMQDLLAILVWEHPGAARDEKPFESLIARCRDYFNGKRVEFADIVRELPGEGTLGGQVLRACRKIEYGQTRSYHIVAEMIGRADAARAVAAALGKNSIPLVVPCHRVTYSDGRPGGFSAPGGVEVKTRMLELERRANR
jgi:methylated-DNA-[protein]-cysteine S-methyltransferase